MKTIILYSSKTGTTRRCAKLLQESLPDATLIDLDKSFCNNLYVYDKVIIGSHIRAGMMSKSVKKFIDENEKTLLKKEYGIFISCATRDRAKLDEIFSQNLPEGVVENAKVMQSFGGELDPEKFKGFEKIIMKMVMKNSDNPQPVDFDKIDEFALCFK